MHTDDTLGPDRPPPVAGLAADLADLLEREATALRQADFAALEPLVVEKERLVSALAAAAEAPSADLSRALQAQATRNGALLAAAQGGLRAAADRLSSLARPPKLQTYDDAGRRSDLARQAPSTERRA